MTSETSTPRRGWRFWAIMTSMGVISLLAGLDATAVSTAMPSIIHDLGSSQGYMWIANAYLLTTTAFTPIFGQTADIFGRRALTLLAILVFAIGSAIAGPAPNLGVLVAGRAIQGIGCAGINVMIETVVCDLVPLRERGKFMGFIFGIYGIATTTGPLIGGAFAASDATWRWVFYLNLPLSGAALATVLTSFGALSKGSDAPISSVKRIDWVGNAFLATCITSILLALTWGGGEQPWSSWKTVVPLVLGLAGLPVFLLYETRVKEPTTPLRLFANRTSFAGNWLAFTHNMLVFYTLFALPIYFQAVLGVSAFRSGVNILPAAATAMPFTILSGAIMTKTGRYLPLLVVGFAIFPVAFGLFTRLDESSGTGYWAGIQVILAMAIGVGTPITLPTILTPLPEADVAVATATWAFMRGFGTIWGAAIPLAVFNSKVDALVATKLQDNEPLSELLANGGAYALAAGGAIQSLYQEDPDAKAVMTSIYVESLKLSWQVGLGFALFGFLFVLPVRELPMRTELETEFGLTVELAQKTTNTNAENEQGPQK
ncbi:unnamed protein product [Clonostachys rosea]|uniref:Major facilitator superfamily (MFS) profile domain-containing protein n=1 Tax=Bionectria ochroleuca TaxID=29856 RepID=A0ABY6UCC0_BIOOC|nr:unnamed protein product [Clonostachys rosea]